MYLLSANAVYKIIIHHPLPHSLCTFYYDKNIAFRSLKIDIFFSYCPLWWHWPLLSPRPGTATAHHPVRTGLHLAVEEDSLAAEAASVEESEEVSTLYIQNLQEKNRASNIYCLLNRQRFDRFRSGRRTGCFFSVKLHFADY